jgi:ketosteroid isomerase-like protein
MPHANRGWFLTLSPVVLTVGIAVVLSAGLARPAHAQEDPIHGQLRALRDGMFQAYEKRDVDKLLSYLEPGVVVTWQNGDRTVGPEELRAFYNRMMNGDSRVVTDVKSKLTVDGLSTLYSGDTAIAKGTLEDSFVLASGNTFVLNSKWTATVVKSGDDWKVASFHASSSIFDNPILSAAQQWTMTLVGIGFVGGIILGGAVMAVVRRGRPAAGTA